MRWWRDSLEQNPTTKKRHHSKLSERNNVVYERERKRVNPFALLGFEGREHPTSGMIGFSIPNAKKRRRYMKLGGVSFCGEREFLSIRGRRKEKWGGRHIGFG